MTRFDVVCGPTASGKSAAVMELARRCGGEILSIDSMKLYRGLDIGTAKPTAAERAEIRHHLIDIKEPWESCSVAEFLKLAEGVIADTQRRGVRLIGEGGTALYVKALAEGLFEGPGADPQIRKRLEDEGQRIGVEQLHAKLKAVDPAAASKILSGDLRRIVRALEVYELTGKPITSWQQQWGVAREDMDVRLYCLRLPRELLYKRIDARVDAMLAAGWLDECRRLLALPQGLSREALQALGYRTLIAHLNGEMTLEAARERICFDTHHFARRQMMWYRKLPKLTWIDLTGSESAAEIADRLEAAMR
ncbi:MAG TPA: tRNA (adenosine(37)-N6)-dimethylallyltransferase MiaA [Planctomycetota bacterium]|nr:tRNA (adenosine(37)-N6)-dimethylallyltransferase MiaA [Planctomycetota bacterium]